jgi:acyl carrier protein
MLPTALRRSYSLTRVLPRLIYFCNNSYLYAGNNYIWLNHIRIKGIYHKRMDIDRKITEILVTKLAIAETEVTPDANFIKDLGIDSLDYAELVMEFEDAFGIKIPDNEAEKLQTISEAIVYIRTKVTVQSDEL